MLLYVHKNYRFIWDGSPGRPPRLSHSSWALTICHSVPCKRLLAEDLRNGVSCKKSVKHNTMLCLAIKGFPNRVSVTYRSFFLHAEKFSSQVWFRFCKAFSFYSFRITKKEEEKKQRPATPKGFNLVRGENPPCRYTLQRKLTLNSSILSYSTCILFHSNCLVFFHVINVLLSILLVSCFVIQ